VGEVIWKEWVAGLVYIEEATYVEMPEPMEKIYHEKNGEIMVNNLPSEMFEKEFVATFRVHGNQFGHWQCTIFRNKVDGRYYLEQEWVPKFGYAWSERIIYRLREL
jgi:hypothetical protein